jgi:branched-subunit amino acid transport protein
MSWLSVIIAGILTYITRMTMVTLVDGRILSAKLKQVLGYVPAAVFPAIIFPAVFLNESGILVNINDPKIIAATIAIIVGYFTKNVIATILTGLISYWFIIFLM